MNRHVNCMHQHVPDLQLYSNLRPLGRIASARRARSAPFLQGRNRSDPAGGYNPPLQQTAAQAGCAIDTSPINPPAAVGADCRVCRRTLLSRIHIYPIKR